MAESGFEEHRFVAEERFVDLERFGFGSDVDRDYLNPAVAEGFSVGDIWHSSNVVTYMRSLLEGDSMTLALQSSFRMEESSGK